jgi:hypothetical protein
MLLHGGVGAVPGAKGLGDMRLGEAIGVQELVAEAVNPRELPLPVSEPVPAKIPVKVAATAPAREHLAADAR